VKVSKFILIFHSLNFKRNTKNKKSLTANHNTYIYNFTSLNFFTFYFIQNFEIKHHKRMKNLKHSPNHVTYKYKDFNRYLAMLIFVLTSLKTLILNLINQRKILLFQIIIWLNFTILNYVFIRLNISNKHYIFNL